MSMLFSENVFDTIRDFGENITDTDIIKAAGWATFGTVVIVIIVYGIANVFENQSNSIAFVGQYSISNYSGSGDYKVILLSKHKINGSIILENENDITDKLLLVRIPYS